MNEVATAGWQQIHNENGICLCQRWLSVSPVPMLRAETEVGGVPAALLALLLDMDNLIHWVAQYRQAAMLQQQGVVSFRVYVRIGTPFFMKQDRDAVVASDVSWQDGVLRISNRLDMNLYRPQEDTRPMKMLHGCWQVRKLTKGVIAISYSGLTDPAAEPAWLVNQMARRALYDTFVGLRREVVRPKYQTAGQEIERLYWQQLQRQPVPEPCRRESF